MLTTLFRPTNLWRSQPTPGKSSGEWSDPRGGRDSRPHLSRTAGLDVKTVGPKNKKDRIIMTIVG